MQSVNMPYVLQTIKCTIINMSICKKCKMLKNMYVYDMLYRKNNKFLQTNFNLVHQHESFLIESELVLSDLIEGGHPLNLNMGHY